MSQIFTTVGPAHHEEFDIDIMSPLYERFGLLYYGCCEALHHKMDMIRKVKNVRKISVSPWADIDISAENFSGDYVFSGKPHPVHVTTGTLQAEGVKKQVLHSIEACKRNNTPCELILKDVSTVSGNPEVLSQWEKLVMSLVER